MVVKTKYIVAGIIGLVTITGAAIYLQYRKMMDYVLSFKAVKLRKITKDLVSADVYLNMDYKGDVPLEIVEQEYKVYVNNYLASNIRSNASVMIKKGMNIIPINVSFSPSGAVKQIKSAEIALAALANQGTIKIKIEMKFFVRFLLFNVSIPYTYETTLKELLAT